MRTRILGRLALLPLTLFVCAAFLAAQQPPPQQESVAEAARKARAQKKAAPRSGRVFTNENLPAVGRLTVAGEARVPRTEGELKQEEEAAAAAAEEEADWRRRFADSRTALRQAERERDILQREFEQLRVQYNPDPQKTLLEEFHRRAIFEHQQKIEAKEKEIRELRQAISDLEDELRRAGKPAAWGREP